MELFYDWHDPSSWGTDRCDAGDHGIKMLENDPFALFCDFNQTLVTLFQVLTTNNWHEIMYQGIPSTECTFGLSFCGQVSDSHRI